MDPRLDGLKQWLSGLLPSLGVASGAVDALETVCGDASARRYFRLREGQRSWIAVDSPPEQVPCEPFIAIAESWRRAGLRVPQIHAANAAQGYMLLQDFGSSLMLDRLTEQSVEPLYRQAVAELRRLQGAGDIAGYALPHYDGAFFQRELALFPQWFLQGLLQLELSAAEWQLLRQTDALLIASALAQPKVCVHRDYHSRNLMVLEDGLGVIDLQDAVIGPVTYDLVSLLRDCYIRWPQARTAAWREQFRQQLGLTEVGPAQFARWFDLMGMQRHLKCLGIFARLKLRDNKPGYIKELPRVLGYVVEVAHGYAELAAFAAWLDQRLLPAMRDSGLFLPDPLQECG